LENFKGLPLWNVVKEKQKLATPALII
jgi:hypothetical protein